MRFWKKKSWGIFRIFLGILIIVLFGSSIIFDLIFFITKWYPNFLLRFIIVFILFNSLLKFTWFGKELEEFFESKFKKKFLKNKFVRKE